ncbi:MAG: hypothetical protein EI684_00780 [Candidatus Viridilinea halotolerans]|uniref:Uncharacterized protein n=1 Tax=Candidatus Viridilinea halotolerans TaxID=2491704 RepID=A0A426UBN9_9CHLR|nr:MAG: hypothetical protein EI684_00780 [Candidatus Viridilinea halotolerans]
MSVTTALRTIPAAHLTFDLASVFELARHLSSAEQDQLIMMLLRERSPGEIAVPSELEAQFAVWDQESNQEPPTLAKDAAYDAMLARLKGGAA